jgi:hypothetical protein
MDPGVCEQSVHRRPDRFDRKSAALVLGAECVPEHRELSARVEADREITGELTLVHDADLDPAPGGRTAEISLRLDQVDRRLLGERQLPILVSSDLGVRAVRGEDRGVVGTKRPEDGPLGLVRQERLVEHAGH